MRTGTEGNSGEGGSAGTGQATRQRLAGLPDDGLQPRQLLPLQGTLRQGRRGGVAGDLAAQAGVEEPGDAGDRAGGGGVGDRRAGLGPAADGQRTEEARAFDLGRRGALRLAAPRSRDHAEAAQGAGGQERAGRPGAERGQLAALEKAKADKEAHGEFESECPGYCGAQDTFYVGTLKGVGRIYQQTFLDTYTKVAFAKLYDRKTPLVAADLLNDRVVPFFDEQGSATEPGV